MLYSARINEIIVPFIETNKNNVALKAVKKKKESVFGVAEHPTNNVRNIFAAVCSYWTFQ